MSLKGETSNPNDERKVLLRSSDHEVFTIKEDVAMKLKTVAVLLDDRKDSDVIIPVPGVKSSILQKVIEYCEHHVDDKEEDDDFNLNRDVTRNNPFGDELRHADLEVLFDLIQAAIYLNVMGLLDLSCDIVADMMKDKSVEEMREILHIGNEYTPEEEENVRKGISWTFDN